MFHLLYLTRVKRVTIHPTKSCSILKHNNTSLFSTNTTDKLSHKAKHKFHTHKTQKLLTFFKTHSFSDTQISRILKAYPRILNVDPQTTILPKLQFFESKGISKSDLCTIVASTPSLLHRSLKGYLMPTFEFYKNLLDSDEMVVFTMKRFHGLFLYRPGTVLVPRLDVLRSYGVPESRIAKLVAGLPGIVMVKIDTLKRKMEEVKELGICPKSLLFVVALKALICVRKDTWEKRVGVYKKWGWSEETVVEVFRKFPNCMTLSNDKITAVMEHFVDKLGCEAIVLSNAPSVLGMSLEKRIIPRTSVLKFLREEGLRSKSLSWHAPLMFSELQFLNKYVYAYEKLAPQLLKLYLSVKP